jgi:2-methylcitrate dehydratase PrpD
VTATDEILALAAAAAAADRPAVTVTDADVAAFLAAAALGADRAVVRALLAVRRAAEPTASPGGYAAPPSGDPAWTAWLTATAAAAGEAATAGEAAAGGRATGTPRPTWCAVLGAAVALTEPPGSAPTAVSVPAAVTAGLGAAVVVESGLAEWGGWSSGPVAAVVGAGVTAGLLIGLAEPPLRAAIGICATQAAGLRAAEGTDAFALAVGKAAFNGVEAALLARAGLTAPAEPLDGRRGLFALFGG